MTSKSFTPYHVRNNPVIFTGCSVKRPKENSASTKGTTVLDNMPPLEATEQKGDLLIRDLWNNGIDSVHNMRVENTDSKSHLAKTPEKCLQEAEEVKKKIYLEACLQQHQYFSPLVTSVDGLMGMEATDTLKSIAIRLATKWRKPCLRTCGYVNSRVAITLVQATHRCIQGSRVPAQKIVSRACSGKTAPGSTSSGKRAERS